MVVKHPRVGLPAIFLMGPTASGKTEIATKLFDQFPSELISVDAAQVYRGMDIGTAKPDPEFLNNYPHHLIDVRNIDERYSVAEFCDDANTLVKQIQQRGKISIFVGGTMFYFAVLEHGLSKLPSADPGIRRQIVTEIREKGLAALHQELKAVDPVMAQKISPSDSQRIQRAIEIFRLTSAPPSQLISVTNTSLIAPGKFGALENQVIKIALFTGDRKCLHRQIKQRFLQMLERGLVDEVRELVRGRDDAENLTSMRSVGYRQVLDYLLKRSEYQQMVEKSVTATRQLAKRQLTWMRNQSNLVWFENSHPKNTSAMIDYLKIHLSEQL